MVSEAELVRRCLEGEGAAFGTLVERHREGAVGFCYHQIGDFHAAEDLAQEAFLRAYSDLGALREPAKFSPWLRAIALRLCQSWHRRRRENPLPPEELARCADAQPDREAFAQSRICLQTQQALQTLPEAQRLTLTLKYLDGYTLSEIAALLEAPVETIRTRLRRAKQRLKEVGVTMFDDDAGPAHTVFTRRVLEKVELLQTASGLTWPLYACLHALGNDWSLAYLMGVTGTAFRFTVDKRVADTGPTDVLDWDHWFGKIRELGYAVRVFNAQLKSHSPSVRTNTEEEFHAIQTAAWDAARASLDQGVPVIAWHPFTREQKARGIGGEFGLLVGYDQQAGVYWVRLPGTAMYTVPWDGFGRADPVNWFNVIVFGEQRPVDERALERAALQYAVEHAHSRQVGHGLGGYALWLKALETGQIQPDGGSKAARLLKECRAHAAAFLREIGGHFPAAAVDLSAAAKYYQQVAKAWEHYLRLFEPTSADAAREPMRTAAVRERERVQSAYGAEQAAVERLEWTLTQRESA